MLKGIVQSFNEIPQATPFDQFSLSPRVTIFIVYNRHPELLTEVFIKKENHQILLYRSYGTFAIQANVFNYCHDALMLCKK